MAQNLMNIEDDIITGTHNLGKRVGDVDMFNVQRRMKGGGGGNMAVPVQAVLNI